MTARLAPQPTPSSNPHQALHEAVTLPLLSPTHPPTTLVTSYCLSLPRTRRVCCMLQPLGLPSHP